MLERLLAGLDAAGLKKHGRGVRIAEKTGYSTSQISALLSGAEPLNARFIISVCKEFGINQEWVITGEGEMLETTKAKAGEVSPASVNPVVIAAMLDSGFAELPIEEQVKIFYTKTKRASYGG